MGHVHHQRRADPVGDAAEGGEVDGAREEAEAPAMIGVGRVSNALAQPSGDRGAKCLHRRVLRNAVKRDGEAVRNAAVDGDDDTVIGA